MQGLSPQELRDINLSGFWTFSRETHGKEDEPLKARLK